MNGQVFIETARTLIAGHKRQLLVHVAACAGSPEREAR